MNIDSFRWFRGPNIWAACPVLEVVLDLREVETWNADRLHLVVGRFLPDQLIPPLLGEETAAVLLGHVFGEGLRKLQTLAGTPVSGLWVAPTSQSGTVRVAVEFAEEPVALAALEIARRLLQAAREGPAVLTPAELKRLTDAEYETRLPVSTAVIHRAARARGIPSGQLNREYLRYLRLGQGAKQHRCEASEPDTIGSLAETISTDKYLANQLMKATGIPIPVGRLVGTIEEAWAAACELGVPVALKPHNTDQQLGVSLDLRSREQVEKAYHFAREHSEWILVERFAPGLEHRVLITGDRISAVTRIDPPLVVGDGVSTVAQLVATFNADPRRSDDGGYTLESDAPLFRLKLDDVARGVLANQGYTVDSVVPAGVRVLVRRNPPYFKHGGRLIDLTDQIHPTTAAHALAAAQVLQLPVAGVDVVALDITRPLEEQGGVIVEVNAGPGIWLHLAPWADNPRPVGEDIVASLFPPDEDGRIPVIALVGEGIWAETVRSQLTTRLAAAGLRLGSVSATEMVFGGRCWPVPPGTPQERATLLFQHPAVDVALLLTTTSELVEDGFGNDRCDVAVLPGAAPRGAWCVVRGAEEPASGEFLRPLRHALAPGGAFVVPASTPSRHDCVRAEGDSLLLERPGTAPVVLGRLSADLSEQETQGLIAAVAVAVALKKG
jgi:cyanophycin synthetase